MKTPRWIGLTGRAGSGKTYVAHSLAMAGAHYVEHFAASLRLELEDVLAEGAHLAPLWTKPTSPEVRWILQQYGTNFRRAQDPDYWVDTTLARVEQTFSHIRQDSVVFDDVRFPNEARAISRRGGLIVRVQAPAEVREARLGELPPEHDSETAMDDYAVDMHITSTEDNLAFEGQVNRVLVEATYDSGVFLQAIADSMLRGG